MRLRAELIRVYQYMCKEQSSDNGLFSLAEKKVRCSGRKMKTDRFSHEHHLPRTAIDCTALLILFFELVFSKLCIN